MKGLELDGAQQLGAQPRVKGGTRRCNNLSEAGDGTLRVVLPDKVVASLQGRPVACDRRGEWTHLFIQEDDGTLREACRLSDGNVAEYPDRELARLEERVVQGVGTGEFLVLRCESGRLLYLRYADGRYEWLGGLPDAPRFELRAESEISFEGRVAPVSFKGTLTDLRTGLDADNLARVDVALKAGLEDAVRSAARSGYRVMPVMVRVAWRLWDGSLLHVSDAQRISGSGDLPGKERVMLGLTADGKGFTGTEAGSVSVNVYRLKVIPGGDAGAAWRGVLKGVEVWVSRQGDYLRAGASVNAAYYQGTGSAQLACTFPVRTEDEIIGELAGLPMSRQLETEGWVNEVYVPVDEDAELSDAMTGEQVPEQSDSDWLASGDALLAYGGFLHVASGADVRTSRRGNPFVTQSVTRGIGGDVLRMWPQLIGGGAYTRQYVYLATVQGVVALTHDRDGVHTNCRLIAPVVVGGNDCGVATGRGLILSGSGGEVVIIKDARAEMPLRRVDGVKSVVYSGSRGWIMLCGERESLVLQEDAEMRGFTRSFVSQPMSDCFWRRLSWHETSLGAVMVYDSDLSSNVTPPMSEIWQGLIPSPGSGGGEVRRLHVPVSGSPVMAQAILRVGRDEDLAVLSSVQVSGVVSSGVNLRCISAGNLFGAEPEYEVMLGGCYSRLGEICWGRS